MTGMARKARVTMHGALWFGALLLAGCGASVEAQGTNATPAQTAAEPMAVHGNIQTFEIGPVLLAADKYYPGPATVKMGGIPNLVGAPPIGGFGSAGVADVATHAETQILRYSVDHPNLRVILNVTEGLYRIVARRSSGISSVKDLAGKRIATIPTTSSGYFLSRMLAREGLSYDDITVGSVPALAEMGNAIKRGDVDAVVIWEPYSELAVRALGDDAIEFDGKGVYRELFNLNTTAENLADPKQRAKIVTFVRAIMDAVAETRRDPRATQELVAKIGNFAPQDVTDAWKHHSFNANMPADLLDVLTEEEKWLASRDNRPARSRAQLATLIDDSVYREALALGSNR